MAKLIKTKNISVKTRMRRDPDLHETCVRVARNMLYITGTPGVSLCLIHNDLCPRSGDVLLAGRLNLRRDKLA